VKLNYDCVRDVLLFLETIDYVSQAPDGDILFCEVDISRFYESLPDHSHEDIFYALFNLEQAGLIDATSHDADNCVYYFVVNYITYSGHEFLEHIKPASVWENTKTVLAKAGSMSIDIITKVTGNIIASLLVNTL